MIALHVDLSSSQQTPCLRSRYTVRCGIHHCMNSRPTIHARILGSVTRRSSMTVDEKHPKRERDRTDESESHSESPVGTETAVKGDSSTAKRQAERDWNDSAKESGE